MYTVYIIRNEYTNKFYIGSTNNYKRRESEHNRGQNRSTKRKGRWKLVYKEEFNTKSDAIRREKQIKSFKGGQAFKKLLQKRR